MSGPESKSDTLYRHPAGDPAPFVFNARVAEVFPDMIARSVPGYAATLRLIGSIADRYVTAGSRVYDLGCSLGAASLSVHRQTAGRAEILAVDHSPAMVERLRSQLAGEGVTGGITVRCEDIRSTVVERASLSILNFTLQFVPVEDRLPLLSRIFKGTLPGGALVLSEKIRFSDPDTQAEMTALHEAFKRENGYTDLEVAQKRAALEQILIPETLEVHRARLHQAGFHRCEVWLQCFNFVSLIAYKA